MEANFIGGYANNRTAQTMSKMAYMEKWRGLTDVEAGQELKQIAMERELLEDTFVYRDHNPITGSEE